ncbi:serine-rich adhesin for platelets [Pseudorasbora parva]|uniref:serine-rich adhesin for platelets n=1 Tax=Pseudorasbora parva TaxID=51549 RepID=UPI00351DDE9B
MRRYLNPTEVAQAVQLLQDGTSIRAIIRRAESGDGDGDGDAQDGDTKHKTSLFGSILRSKKGLLSYSETDLHKPKGFAASLSWKQKKKKKKRDVSQSFSSNSEVPEVKDYISEGEEYDHQVAVEQNRLDFEAATPTTEPPFTSDQSQAEDILSDMSRPNEEDAGFMPSDLNSTSIPYIDSSPSDSDVYQTPPDSPDYTDTQTADRSSQNSAYVLSFTSQTEPDISGSFCPVPNIKTGSSTAHDSGKDLNPNDVSGRHDHLFSNFIFEASKSGVLADVEVKTLTTDSAQKESYLEPKKLRDAPDAVHQNRISSIDKSSISSTSESSPTSTPQTSISSTSESSPTSIPQSSISSIPQSSISSTSESSPTSIPQSSISSIPQSSISSTSESSPTSIPQKSISSISESSISSIPQSSISSTSESSISSIPQSSISSIPQSSISSTSESSPTSIPQKSISSISESSISSIPRKSLSSIPQSSISSIPQKSLSSIPQKSISSTFESSPTSIPQKSISSVSESSISSIPQSSISSTSESSISSIPQSSISSIPQSSISSVSESSISSIPQRSISSIPQSSISSVSESSISSIPQSSFSSVSESSTTSSPQSSNSLIIDFISNSTVIQSSSPNSNSVFTFGRSSTHPASIISTEAEVSRTSTAHNRSSSGDIISSDPSTADICKSASSMPDVSYAIITENSLDADTDLNPILSFSRTDVSESNLSSVTHSLPTVTMHSTSDSSFLEETHPAINCETISMESHQTDNYSSSTFAADSEKPAEPVLLEDELNIALPQSFASQAYTIINTVTFDLSGPSDPISPEHSQKGLFNNMSYSDVETLTETSAECHVCLDNDQAEFANSSETASDFQDSTSETISAIIVHPPLHLDGSYQLFNTQSPKEERDKQKKYCEEDVQEASTQSSELTGQDETTEESMTTRNDLQMSVKSKYGLEVEDGSRLDPDFHYKYHVKSIQELESIEILTTAESMTTRNDLQMSVKSKFGPQVEEEREIYDENDVSLNEDKGTEAEQIMNEQILLHKVSENYEVEELNDEFEVVHSRREAEVCVGTEVLTGEEEPQIHRLAPLHPALPVPQECSSEECTPAPPFSEVSLADSSMETHLEVRLRPLAPHLSGAEIAILQDTAKCKHQTHTDNSHAEHTGTFLSRTPERESQEHSGENTRENIRDNISLRDGLRVSESTSENNDSAEGNTGSDQLLSTSLIPGERFFHASSVLSTVIEESETEAETEPGSDSEMSSSVAVFSTKLSRPSSAREGRDEAMKVRKVSLVHQETHKRPSDGFRDQEPSPELERRWESLRSHSEDSSLSPSYKKRVYTSHFDSTQPYDFSSNWNVYESEDHGRSESYTGGRIRAERSSPEEGEGEREQVRRQTGFDSEAQYDSSLRIVETDSSDVFQATRVELIPSPTGFEPEALSPLSFSEMDNFVDTLKSMERPIRNRLQRTPSNTPFSSLPPIEEDAPISPRTPLSPLTPASPVYEPKTHLNGLSSLPADIGLHWSSPKDMRSPLTMMKEQQFGDPASRGISLPMRASALNSIVMRRSSLNDLASPEEAPAKVNGNGSSRLENSFFFQPTENGNASSRSIFRAASLPEISPSLERMSSSGKGSENLLSSRFERFSFLTSPSNSLAGFPESSRMSVAPPLQETYEHKSTSDLYRSLPSETLLKNSLPRSSSLDGGFLINESFQKPEPEQNVVPKYRAFPDAYLTKEKEHGKLNPRPGKMLIYDRPGMSGERIEVRGDVVDATPWEFTDTISVRVIRGGWVLYEKPEFKGEKFALDEGDIELNDPFGPPDEEEVSKQQEGTKAGRGEGEEEPEPRRKRRFVIGSIRRAVRDYSVPEISLFPEENAEGKKVTFRDTSDDSRIFGFPIKANSIIINAGLWLVFAEPFFQGVPRVLEVGGFSNPAAWGVTHPYVASLHPLKIGEPKVENLYEPKIVLYEKPYFTGKSREIYSSMRDFLSRVDKQQSLFMFSAGSIKVLGGCWVGYEKEGFRGYQYLLEEGEYHDWRVWGGVNSELRSLRVIQADLSEPQLVLYGMPEEEKQEEEDEERSFEVTETVPDVELFGFGINTRSIHVLSGAWVAYSHVDFSGNQYVLEKGFYNNCSDWGSEDNRICSIQPILAAPREGPSFRNEVLLYSELDFQGSCRVCHQNQSLPESLAVQSCRVVGGSWVLYGGEQFTGDMCVLSEGDYPNRTSMGFPTNSSIRSVKAVPMTFSVPSISLFGLECFEGREVVVDTQVSSMQEEGFNTHFLSVRVNSGSWVLCEHSNYRGRQFLLEPIEISNWQKFSSVSCIGSLYPVRQKQRLFRIRNRESGQCVSVQGGVEDMKTGRVVVSEQVEGMSDLWLYQDGLIKNKLARSMSLQVMGNVESGAKVVLWTETRVPVQTWSAEVKGRIRSNTFPGMLLDIKGGKTYDREHVVIRAENEESLSQQWELEFL